MRDESVQVGICGSLDIKVSLANIVECLVVKHNSDVGVITEEGY